MRISPRPNKLAIVISLLVLAMGCATTSPSGLPEVQTGGPGAMPGDKMTKGAPIREAPLRPGEKPSAAVAPAPVVVPLLSGRTVQEVEKQLVPHKLRLGQVTSQVSDRPEGTIIDQNPKPGARVESGIAVDVVVAAPAAVTPLPVVVPRLSGRTLQEVKSLLARSGLRLGTVASQATGQAQPGTVIDQRPRAGERVERNVAVALVVEAPPPQITVPSVIGTDEKETAAILADSGLRLGQVTSQESDRPPGTIIDQNPKPGAPIKSGTAVDVVVAAPAAVVFAVGISDQGTTLEALKWKLLAVGLGLIVLILVIAVLIPHPTSFQYIVFRTTLALAAACVASALPGFFEFKRELPQAGIAAGGALAVFVLVYMFDPGKMKGKIDANSRPTDKGSGSGLES